jgi:hypothetical protein
VEKKSRNVNGRQNARLLDLRSMSQFRLPAVKGEYDGYELERVTSQRFRMCYLGVEKIVLAPTLTLNDT